MAGFVNRVFLMGNLTKDPEVKTVNNTVCNVGIAVNRKWKDRDGNACEEVTFVDLEAWGRTAEIMGQYLRKGSPVFIEGRLKLDQWTDRDNNRRQRLKVVVDTMQMLGSGQGDGGGQQQTAAPAQAQTQSAVTHIPADTMDDEPPF